MNNNIQSDSVILTEMTNKRSEAKEFEFSANDLMQIENHGISLNTVNIQLSIFETGVSKTILDRPATINDGIIVWTEQDQQHFTELFENQKSKLKIMKFVPASGAASRMFGF